MPPGQRATGAVIVDIQRILFIRPDILDITYLSLLEQVVRQISLSS